MKEENKSEKNINASLKDFLDGEKKIPDAISVDNEFDGNDIEDDMVVPQMEEGFKPIISDISPQEKLEKSGIKPTIEESDGKIFTIKSVEFGLPKTKEMIDGSLVPVAPKVTLKAKAKFYEAKLKVKFEENNFVEYYPQIRYWVRDGKIDPRPSIDRDGNNKVSQLVRLVVQAKAKEEGIKFDLITTTINERQTIVPSPSCFESYKEYEKKLSDAAIIQFLIGKKVKMKVSKGVMDGRPWHRSDIVQIL